MTDNNDVKNVEPVSTSSPVSPVPVSPVPVSPVPVSPVPVVSHADNTPETSQFLAAVPTEKSFTLSNGRIISRLEELYDVISSDNENIFHNHVNLDKNDFVTWIRSSLNYVALADKLLPVRDKINFLKILGEDIALLKNPALKNTMNFFQEPQTNLAHVSLSSSSGEIAALESFSKEPSQQEKPAISNEGILSVNPAESKSVSDTLPLNTPSDSGTSLNSSFTALPENQLPEEHYEFEDIFSGLITEIETEILYFDS